MAKILVTGASGLLGANFALAAAARFRVTACHGRHRLALPGVENVACDLRQPGEVARLLEAVRPEIIAHLAAATDVERCQAHPDEAREINVRAVERLAGWAAKNGARFVLMSTDSVFDGTRGGYSEIDEPKPLNQYARTKLEAEHCVRALVPNHLILRANIFGWNAQPKQSLSEWILCRLEAGQEVPGFTDVIFSPLLVNTLADVMLLAAERGIQGVFHAASKDAVTKHEFALAIADCFGFSRRLIVPATATAVLKAPRPKNTTLTASKLCTGLGIILPSVQEELARFKRLRDEGYVSQLKGAFHSIP